MFLHITLRLDGFEMKQVDISCCEGSKAVKSKGVKVQSLVWSWKEGGGSSGGEGERMWEEAVRRECHC